MDDGLSRFRSDAGLSDHAQSVIDTTRQLVADVIGPNASELDRSDPPRFPTENFEAIRDAGLLGLCIPKEHGGLGAGLNGDLRLYYQVLEELAAGCPSTSQLFGVHCISIFKFEALATPEQQARFYAEVLEEGATFASLGSEPRVSVLHANTMDTAGKRDGDTWTFSGKKNFGTGSAGFRYAILLTLGEGSDTLSGGLLQVVVPLDADGVEITENWNPMGQRSTCSYDVTLTNVEIDDGNVIGGPGDFFDHPILGQTFQLTFAAVYVGMARGAVQATVSYAMNKSRPWVGLDSVGQDPYITYHMANSDIGARASALLMHEAAWTQEQAVAGNMSWEESAAATYRARVASGEAAIDAGNRLFEVCGARATARSQGVDHWYRDARTLTLHDSLDRRREVLGKYVLGYEGPKAGII